MTSSSSLVPPRRMLDWGPTRLGYCGETCLQMALMLNRGCYMSSEIIHRAINCEELLIGTGNEIRAAKVVGLDDSYEVYQSVSRKVSVTTSTSSSNLSFPEQQSHNFIQEFIPKHIDQGHIITAGFYGLYDDGKGDEDYDHIMPIVEYRRNPKKNNIVDRIGYLDLWSTSEVRYLEGDDLLKLKTRKECWRKPQQQQGKKKSSYSCVQHPLPWFLPLEHVYAIAFKNNFAVNNNDNNNIVPLTVQVSYSMEPDCRRLFTSWYKDGRHPYEDQLTVSIPMTKNKEQMRKDYQQWFDEQINSNSKKEEVIFSKVFPRGLQMTSRKVIEDLKVPIKITVNEQYNHNRLRQQKKQTATAEKEKEESNDNVFVILKLQGILAYRNFQCIIKNNKSSPAFESFRDDGICNVSVVHQQHNQQQTFVSETTTEVLCTEVAYFVGVKKSFFEQTLMKNDDFLRMVKNYENMVIKNKEFLAKTTKKNEANNNNNNNDEDALLLASKFPISLPHGYMGVDISTESDDEDEE